MEKPVDRIIRLFGGVTAMARALGHKYPSTVQNWKTRGIIPAIQQQAVLDAAREHGVSLTGNDFFAPVNGQHPPLTSPARPGVGPSPQPDASSADGETGDGRIAVNG